MFASVGALLWDLRTNNEAIGGLMKFVWIFTVLYSGPLGLVGYLYSGRRQIAHDSLWRRGFRSVAHCYSGCGAGEITGIVITVGLLALGNFFVALVTFTLAYVAGFMMTVGPLVEEGVAYREALFDAFYSETASIVVMKSSQLPRISGWPAMRRWESRCSGVRSYSHSRLVCWQRIQSTSC